MIAHADRWISAWNRRDLDDVLAGYGDHACFRSPFAKAVAGTSHLEGKQAMEAYWRLGLERLPNLHFELLSALCDVEAQVMLVHYLAPFEELPRRACEIFMFEAGLKVYAEALYGDWQQSISA